MVSIHCGDCYDESHPEFEGWLPIGDLEDIEGFDPCKGCNKDEHIPLPKV